MAIGNAVQRGPTVYVYDENNRPIFNLPAGGVGPQYGLAGYTSSRVNVRHGSAISSYDEKGRLVGNMPAR